MALPMEYGSHFLGHLGNFQQQIDTNVLFSTVRKESERE